MISKITQYILAIILGVLLLFPLGWVFGVFNWPMYHSWGLMHGALVSAIPTMAIAAYGLLGEASWFKSVQDPYRRLLALIVGMAINALFVIVHMNGEYSILTVGSLQLLSLVLVASLFLSYKAKSPIMVALMIPLPLLFNDLQFFIFIMSFDALVAYIRYTMTLTTIPVFTLAFIGCWAAQLAAKKINA